MGTRTKSLAVLLVSIMLVTAAVASGREEFHKTYPLSAGGSVSVKNVNGTVKISTWSRNEVDVVAIKTADSEQKLRDCTIDVFATSKPVAHGLKPLQSTGRPHETAQVRKAVLEQNLNHFGPNKTIGASDENAIGRRDDVVRSHAAAAAIWT